MLVALGYLMVTGAGAGLLMAGQMWWAAGVLFVGLLGMNAMSRL